MGEHGGCDHVRLFDDAEWGKGKISRVTLPDKMNRGEKYPPLWLTHCEAVSHPLVSPPSLSKKPPLERAFFGRPFKFFQAMDAKMTSIMSRFDDNLTLPPPIDSLCAGGGARKRPERPLKKNKQGDPTCGGPKINRGANFDASPGRKYDITPLGQCDTREV